MNGPDHYREAERLLEHHDRADGIIVMPNPQTLAAAQVHATLALAAATALANYCGDRMTEGDSRGWYLAASAQPEHARQQREAERAELAAFAEEEQS